MTQEFDDGKGLWTEHVAKKVWLAVFSHSFCYHLLLFQVRTIRTRTRGKLDLFGSERDLLLAHLEIYWTATSTDSCAADCSVPLRHGLHKFINIRYVGILSFIKNTLLFSFQQRWSRRRPRLIQWRVRCLVYMFGKEERRRKVSTSPSIHQHSIRRSLFRVSGGFGE